MFVIHIIQNFGQLLVLYWKLTAYNFYLCTTIYRAGYLLDKLQEVIIAQYTYVAKVRCQHLASIAFTHTCTLPATGGKASYRAHSTLYTYIYFYPTGPLPSPPAPLRRALPWPSPLPPPPPLHLACLGVCMRV